MKWINRNDSEANYEDRRGKSRRNAAVGGVGVIVVAVIALLLGQNPFEALEMVNSMAPGSSSEVVDPSRANENEELKVLTLGVFNSANDVWQEIFKTQLKKQYQPPTLVTFTDATVTEIGRAHV